MSLRVGRAVPSMVARMARSYLRREPAGAQRWVFPARQAAASPSPARGAFPASKHSGAPALTKLQTNEHPFGTTLQTAVAVGRGQVVIRDEGTVHAVPTMHTIQVAEGVHMNCEGPIRFANHSCAPNCVMRVSGEACWLEAVDDIAAGVPLTFDYNTTEWDMSSPFECHCGADGCRKMIQGYKHLDANTRRVLPTSYLSAFVLSKAAESA